MYAVVRTGGKQYRVAPGRQLRVDRLPGEAGDMVNLSEVLLISSEDGTTLGDPTLANAHIVASIVEQGRGKKISVFKYKSKKRYRKLHGHRQRHTDLRVEEIVGPDGATWKHEKKKRLAEIEPVEVEELEGEADEEAAETTAELDDDAEATADTGDGAVDEETVESEDDGEEAADDEAPAEGDEEDD